MTIGWLPEVYFYVSDRPFEQRERQGRATCRQRGVPIVRALSFHDAVSWSVFIRHLRNSP